MRANAAQDEDEGFFVSVNDNRKWTAPSPPLSGSHSSSDEEHLARCQRLLLVVVCHRYHLGNDLFRPVAMATVICMEMMSVQKEEEGEKKRENGEQEGELLLFWASCAITRSLSECLGQQGALWTHPQWRKRSWCRLVLRATVQLPSICVSESHHREKSSHLRWVKM